MGITNELGQENRGENGANDALTPNRIDEKVNQILPLFNGYSVSEIEDVLRVLGNYIKLLPLQIRT